MPATMDAPVLAPSNLEKQDFAAKLRAQTAACRVRHARFGVRRALTREQIKQAADSFGADGKAISAVKKLLDTKHPSYQKVLQIRFRAASYWRSVTVPYPEAGTRLIRRNLIEDFVKRMETLKAELDEAAGVLQTHYEELREKAKADLGDLFNAGDYPTRVDIEFELGWDFPSVDPPDHLKKIHPELYQQECDRIHARFEEAVRLTEQAMMQKLHELIAHLADKLTGGTDGKPKAFRDSAVENLNGFFEEFRNLDIGSNEELQRLVNKAQDAVKGVKVNELRENADVRNDVAASLSQIKASMDEMMVVKPKRAINLEDE